MAIKKAVSKIMATAKTTPTMYEYPIKPPDLAPGVVPDGVDAPVMAMDSNNYAYAAQMFPGGGFPGFSYLSQLATKAEYRAFASALSTEITREFIEFTSKQDDGAESAEKIKLIEAEFKRLNVRGAIQKAAEHDCYFGRGQLVLDIDGADRSTPLILDKRTIKKDSLISVVPVEAIWTTPSAYNSLDPLAPDFYRPSKWYILGQEVHASRVSTIVTRQLPDILKPAYNFAGISLSQLAEPVVDNWLRTRQSVADLINNFSITALATAMDGILQGNDDGANLLDRADFFTLARSNKGLMLLDKDREELVQVNTPLSGLHELQSQAQELMCSISRLPAIILTGISPSGLNASSDGEIRVFYDWIAAQQESFWREPLEIILKVVQLSLFGEIDQDIGFEFVPLYQMTAKEEAEIRWQNCQTDCAYTDHGILDPSEPRERLARDPNSGYNSIDTDVELIQPNQLDDESDAFAQDADKWITVHPNGPDSKGTPALIDESGQVKGWMGGKFNGKNIKDAHGTKSFTSGETNAETIKRNSTNNLTNTHENDNIPSSQTKREGGKMESGLFGEAKRGGVYPVKVSVSNGKATVKTEDYDLNREFEKQGGAWKGNKIGYEFDLSKSSDYLQSVIDRKKEEAEKVDSDFENAKKQKEEDLAREKSDKDAEYQSAQEAKKQKAASRIAEQSLLFSQSKNLEADLMDAVLGDRTKADKAKKGEYALTDSELKSFKQFAEL